MRAASPPVPEFSYAWLILGFSPRRRNPPIAGRTIQYDPNAPAAAHETARSGPALMERVGPTPLCVRAAKDVGPDIFPAGNGAVATRWSPWQLPAGASVPWQHNPPKSDADSHLRILHLVTPAGRPDAFRPSDGKRCQGRAKFA